MSHCVISSIVDTDDHNTMRSACMVHVTYAPCQHNGAPACTSPLHTDDHCDGGRDAAIRFWRLRTHGQRPLVLHHGSFGDDRQHHVDTDAPDCWCEPEHLLATGSA